MDSAKPFDELPYYAFPIAPTAPERLAMVSRFHGGPRTRIEGVRVLEMGCANGANLLPMAWFRRHTQFLGVDGSARQVDLAETARDALGLDNLRFLRADFLDLPGDLGGPFDFIIVHGVLSWVPHAVRDALLAACREHLAEDGLVYLNYNTRPGWTIRGMIREFLMRHTADAGSLEQRAEYARELSLRVITPLEADEHPYTQLMAREFKLVSTHHPAYVGHEYLAPDNHAYWRSEMLALAGNFGLEHVADADFNSPGHLIIDELRQRLAVEPLAEEARHDSLDLLCYRQMHSPIMTHRGFTRRPMDDAEFAGLRLASEMQPIGDGSEFRHPNEQEVEVRTPRMGKALHRLARRARRR